MVFLFRTTSLDVLKPLLIFTAPTITDVLSDSLMKCQSHRLSLGNIAVVLFMYGCVCQEDKKRGDG